MRTSRASKETARVLQALSPPTRRQTRSASRSDFLKGFTYNGSSDEAESVKKEDDSSSLSSVDTVDIEDILEPPAKRRKATSNSKKTAISSSLRTPNKKVEQLIKNESAPPKTRRVPARKIKSEDGSLTVEPPSNWELMYSTVKKMREDNPTAPVDTMGCAELYWRASSQRDRRFQTLIALMLSSQTKDTVTAVAMQRLHTELGDGESPAIKQEEGEYDESASEPLQDSTLNLENILAVSPERLNSLIGTVGFHNNKTKYIKRTAEIIRDQYGSDIPSTPTELMKLPGVGPKMAFLCMSAAWGKHEGIGVDVHVHRITNLWGWHKTKTPEETRMSLESWLPKDRWHEINKLLVGLGQTVCLPVGRRCGDCDLAGTKLCKSEIKGMAPKNSNRVLPKKEEVEAETFSMTEGAKVKIEAEESVPAPMEFIYRENEDNFLHSMEIDAEETRPDVDCEPREMPLEVEDVPAIRSRRAITFLDLPDDVKIRILKYAGLLRPCLINFAYEKNRAKHDRGLCTNGNPVRMTRLSWTGRWLSPYHGTCDHAPLPVGVFLACRAARQELGSLFFAHNRFCIYLHGRQEFNLFSAATEWGLLHLRHLHLNLGGHCRYLKLGGGVHRTILNIWTQFCQNSRERMPALRHFSMKCKVKELDVASRLMCIMDPFPTLSQCAFHFSDIQDDDIRPVIKRAAWRLTGNLRDKPPFPFKKLPKEVQLMILEHVLIKRSDPFLPVAERDTAMVGLLDRKSQPTTNSPLVCCGTCSPLRAFCFCDIRQTAFSTSCTCFSSPLPYFLVNREFYEDCRRLFFTKAHFTFVEEEPEPIMRFLTSIPTSSFMQIRHLSFKFPMTYRVYHKSPRSEEAIIRSWSVLRRFIREHFDLLRLSLSIVDLGTSSISVGRNKYMRRMLKTFTELRGLRDFRVYLADDPSFEKELERAVMGKTSVGRYRPYNMPSIGSTHHTST